MSCSSKRHWLQSVCVPHRRALLFRQYLLLSWYPRLSLGCGILCHLPGLFDCCWQEDCLTAVVCSMLGFVVHYDGSYHIITHHTRPSSGHFLHAVDGAAVSQLQHRAKSHLTRSIMVAACMTFGHIYSWKRHFRLVWMAQTLSAIAVSMPCAHEKNHSFSCSPALNIPLSREL